MILKAKRIKPLKTISLACNERPKILKQALDSLKNQTVNLKDYELYINCEPGNKKVIKLIENIDFIKTDIIINDKKLGINGNTYAPIKRAFGNSDFNLYWEDDIVLCPDALSIMEWYTTIDLKNISTLLLCNLWDKSKFDENLVYKSRRFCGWGFVVSRYQFERYFEPVWFRGPGCWDSSSARYIRTFDKIYNIVPQLSRSTNIGVIGTNMSIGNWKRFMGGHRFNTNRKSFNYFLRDRPEYE